MEKVVELNKTGYDPFFTFMKGYAILCVLLAHAIPNPDATGYALWGGMQVPLFLLIQTFHSFKRKPKLNLGKILKRAILPFLLIQMLLLSITCRHGDICNQLKISMIGGVLALALITSGYTCSLQSCSRYFIHCYVNSKEAIYSYSSC